MDDAEGGTLDRRSLDELRIDVDELRASRARIVAASDAYRRRIERDLHDGVQQQLVAIAVNLQLARERVGSDPEARTVAVLLADMARDVQDALADVRRLAWRVYPSLLRDRGLGEALRAAAAETALPTRVEAPTANRYPAEIEESVYFCCIDLLESVAELAEAATVRVGGGSSSLRLDVTVEGVGLDDHLDLERAADRLAAVGGLLEISWEADTLRIFGTIPPRS